MTRNQERHLRLKYDLAKSGLTLADLARHIGVSHSAVSMIVSGRSRSARIEQAVADALDRKPQDIWPEYYEKEAKT